MWLVQTVTRVFLLPLSSASPQTSASLPLLQIFLNTSFHQHLSLACWFLFLGFGCCVCFQGQKMHSSECPPSHKLGEFICLLIRKTGMTVIVLQLSGCSPSPGKWPYYGCSPVLKPGNAMDSIQINTCGSNKWIIWPIQLCQQKPKSLGICTMMLAKLALTPAAGCSSLYCSTVTSAATPVFTKVYIDVTYWSLCTNGTLYFASRTLV